MDMQIFCLLNWKLPAEAWQYNKILLFHGMLAVEGIILMNFFEKLKIFFWGNFQSDQ